MDSDNPICDSNGDVDSNTQKTDSNRGYGLVILGVIITCFALFVIIVPLIHTLKTGYKPQYTPVFGLGAVALAMGIGLMCRSIVAWIANVTVFAFLALGNIWAYVRTHNQTVMTNAIVVIIILIVLSKCKNQTRKKKPRSLGGDVKKAAPQE